MAAPPYYGPVEALSMEEVAVRLRVSVDFLEKHYDGPIVKFGRLTRISAIDLHEWIYRQRTDIVDSDPWDGVGDDAEESALSGRKYG